MEWSNERLESHWGFAVSNFPQECDEAPDPSIYPTIHSPRETPKKVKQKGNSDDDGWC